MLILSSVLRLVGCSPSLSRRKDANSQLENDVTPCSVKSIKKEGC